MENLGESAVTLTRRAISSCALGDHPRPLRRTVNRNQFLAACYVETLKAPIEHLIVGLGLKHGRTTKISRVMHTVGSVRSVDFTPAMVAAIDAHYQSAHAAEVLLFHNHPHNPFNVLFDNLPVASATDRRLMLKYVLHPVHLAKAASGGGRVRFYIGENEFVGEFTQPHWLDLLRAQSGEAVG
ncbi:MAG: hypothetical protein Q8N18_18570 [Opitutaceae bacterium]|nr:hypothetical protein [Opitutaceae bacterium]